MSPGDTTTPAPAPARPPRFRNSFSVLPLRLFFAGAYAFAGYAKLTYPQFFDDNSPIGFKQGLQDVKQGSPIGGLLTPMINNASVFGHVTAYAELAIAAGLVLGVFTRVAALGGIVLNVLIALSIGWGSIRQYTAASGWYTSVDIAFAVGLTVFLLGGSGPISIDRAAEALRKRRRAKEDAAEGRFIDSDIDASRGRLQPEPVAAAYPPPAWGTPDSSWNTPESQPTQAWVNEPRPAPEAAPTETLSPAAEAPVTEAMPPATGAMPPATEAMPAAPATEAIPASQGGRSSDTSGAAQDSHPTQAWTAPQGSGSSETESTRAWSNTDDAAPEWVPPATPAPTAHFPADARGPHNSDDNPVEHDLEHDSESLWTGPQPGEGSRPHNQ